jgi:hypothetical protein
MIDIGQALMTGTGPVPGPMQAILDQYRNMLRARVMQAYGGQNLSTDPTKNTSLMQDLNAVDSQVLTMREQLGQQIITTANSMLSTGAGAAQIAAELPMMMTKLDMQLQALMGNSIANFAAAMSGGTTRVAGVGSGINLNLNNPGQNTAQTLLS